MMNKQDAQNVLRRALGVSVEAQDNSQLIASLRIALGNLSETHIWMRVGMAITNFEEWQKQHPDATLEQSIAAIYRWADYIKKPDEWRQLFHGGRFKRLMERTDLDFRTDL